MYGTFILIICRDSVRRIQGFARGLVDNPGGQEVVIQLEVLDKLRGGSAEYPVYGAVIHKAQFLQALLQPDNFFALIAFLQDAFLSNLVSGTDEGVSTVVEDVEDVLEEAVEEGAEEEAVSEEAEEAGDSETAELAVPSISSKRETSSLNVSGYT